MRRFPAVFAWSLAIWIVGISVVQAVRDLEGSGADLGTVALTVFEIVAVSAFAITAAFIISRQPRNVIGWLLVVSAAPAAVPFVSDWVNAMDGPPTVVTPALIGALAWDNFSWVPYIFPVFHLLFVFPSGRLLGPRWRWVVRLEVVMVCTMLSISLFSQPIGPFSEAWTVPNPIGFIPASFVNGPFLPIWFAGLLTLVGTGVASMVVRYRRAATTERHQIKWLVFAVTVFGAAYAASAVTALFADGEWGGGWLGILFNLSFANIAFSIAIAVTRYHLFDIDRIISRTVGYATIVGILTAGFFGLVTLVAELTPVQSDPAVAVATLAVAALFNPLRRRVLAAVDRRFNRTAYEARAVAERFAATLKDSLSSPERLTDALLEALDDALEPSSAGIWLSDDAGERRSGLQPVG